MSIAVLLSSLKNVKPFISLRSFILVEGKIKTPHTWKSAYFNQDTHTWVSENQDSVIKPDGLESFFEQV